MRLIATLLGTFFIFAATLSASADTGKPLVLGHRGAAGHLPEHTRAGYELAIKMGADFIEPDLVPTKDGALIARHENNITDTTDAAIKFPERNATKTINGKVVKGWFTEDFTLAEIKTLRARERLDIRSHANDGTQEILTLQEVIDIARKGSQETGRVIGIYPETKNPTYFRSIGLPLEESLVKILKANGYDDPQAPCFIQSFEYQNLQDLRKMISTPIIFLLEDAKRQPYDFVVKGDKRTYGDLTRPEELEKIATFANGIGPTKRLIVPQNADKSLAAPTTLVADAHRAGLKVHPFTFRDEAVFLAPDYRNDPLQEYLQFYKLGVDGLFSDFADTAVKARDLYRQGK
jgi:glycerophosphoryl diester phosphodiesterase